MTNSRIVRYLEGLARAGVRIQLVEPEQARQAITQTWQAMMPEPGGYQRVTALDTADLGTDDVAGWFRQLPIPANDEVTILWPAWGVAARMPFSEFVCRYDDLYAPGRDDVWVCATDWLLELDHEERFRLMRRV